MMAYPFTTVRQHICPVELAPHPAIQAWAGRIEARPAHRKAIAASGYLRLWRHGAGRATTRFYHFVYLPLLQMALSRAIGVSGFCARTACAWRRNYSQFDRSPEAGADFGFDGRFDDFIPDRFSTRWRDGDSAGGAGSVTANFPPINFNPAESDEGRMVLSAVIGRSGRKQKARSLADRTADLEQANSSLRAAYEQVRRHSEELARTGAELAAARAAAEAANAAKSQFLAIMTHELRTPLTSLIGFSELMLRRDFHPDQLRHFLTLQRNAAVALSSLVTNILDFSKIEAGKAELENLPFELGAVIAGCEDLVSQPVAAKGLVLRTVIEDDVPHWAMGDPTRLRQVILNLLTNAVKFTQAGSVELTARMVGGRLRLAIQDTGIGIPPALHSRLFEPFSQVEASTSRRFGGSGLGLAICSRIIEQMGGAIGVESEPGHGSLFWFEIPLLAAAGPEAEIAMPPALKGAISRRVLLAEDNPTNQLLISSMLQAVGHRVEVVGDGAAAVDAAGTGAFDLILLDLQMPVMGGFEAARRIRAVEQDGRHLPIIALTANATTMDVEACRMAGMDDFLAKPIDMDGLIATVARWSAQRQAAQSPSTSTVACRGLNPAAAAAAVTAWEIP